jgi:hypothetical protein
MQRADHKRPLGCGGSGSEGNIVVVHSVAVHSEMVLFGSSKRCGSCHSSGISTWGRSDIQCEH